MFDICLLGTGGMLPLPNRHLTSLLIRFGGSSLLIDCGEGTQISMRQLGWSFKDIDYICFTHYHGDHISGLPGLLLTMGNCDRTEPVTLVGPKGLRRIVEGLLLIAPGLPFQIRYVELTKDQIDEQQEMKLGPVFVRPCRCDHGVPCVGYSVEVKRNPRFDPEKAKANNVPLKLWRFLQKGETVTAEDGTVYTPDLVLAEERKGLKIAYVTDSRPKDTIVRLAQDADLFICEGMYGEAGTDEKAAQHKHMSYREAAQMAKDAGVKELWLTHFSPAMPAPKAFLSEATAIFPNARCGKDRLIREFMYED
ncbi:MAG: ribonuclease Z [Firmicutes bacterium]|nr:ribonuclease Z [Bacillota bacterium]